MADSLLGNINGNYYRNLNVLTGKKDTVKVLVEDELDVPFWMDILKNTTPQKQFKISPYSYNIEGNIENLTKGKMHILQKAQNGDFNSTFIGCVDSDYDGLLSSDNELGKFITNHLYLLQTYAYSIENLMCQAETLGEVCTKSCKTSIEFDFDSFMKEMSSTLFPLLIWGLYLAQNDREGFTVTQWGEIFPNELELYKDNCTKEMILNKLSENVTGKIAELEASYSSELHKLNGFEAQIRQSLPNTAFLNKENCYLFVRGHDLYNFLLKCILKPICQKVKNEHFQAIRACSTSTKKETSDRLKQYSKNQANLESILPINYDYKLYSEIFKWIQQDILKIYGI